MPAWPAVVLRSFCPVASPMSNSNWKVVNRWDAQTAQWPLKRCKGCTHRCGRGIRSAALRCAELALSCHFVASDRDEPYEEVYLENP